MNTVTLKKILQDGVDETYSNYVLPCDQLNTITSKHFAIIVNNQKATEAGQHWLAIFKKEENKEIEFFDSCGMPLSFYNRSIEDFLKKHGSSIKKNQRRIQSAFSDTCGQFCIFFLVHRAAGFTFSEVMSKFSMSNLIKNDEIARRFVRDNFGFHFSKTHCESKSFAEIRSLVNIVQCCQILSNLFS